MYLVQHARNIPFPLWVHLKINGLTLFETKMKQSQFQKNHLPFKFRKVLCKTKIMKGTVPTQFCPQICVRRIQNLYADFFVAKITLFKFLAIFSR